MKKTSEAIKKRFHLRYQEVNQEDFNKYLEFSKYYITVHMSYEEATKDGKTYPRFTRFIKKGTLNCTLTYKAGSRWFNFKTNLSKQYSETIEQPVDPIIAYANFARVVKPLEFDCNVSNLGGYSDHHPDKAGHYKYAICYDVNKSFFNACNNLMPTELVDRFRAPESNEVGFNSNGIPVIGPSSINCAWVFKFERHKGLDRYVEIYTKKLLEASQDKVLTNKYKKEINYSIGNLANHNPFLRNMIVWYSNIFVKSKVDDNTIWSNTDSIISTVRRPDLEIGTGVGQFKIEHEGSFVQAITGYQWPEENKVTCSGLSQDQIKLYEQRTNKQFILGQTPNADVNNQFLWRYNYEKDNLERILN